MMLVKSIGDVILRGLDGYGTNVQAAASIILSPEGVHKKLIQNKIMLIKTCNDDYLPLIKECAGVVLETQSEDYISSEYLLLLAKALDVPVLITFEKACNLIQDNQVISLRPREKIIYDGIVHY